MKFFSGQDIVLVRVKSMEETLNLSLRSSCEFIGKRDKFWDGQMTVTAGVIVSEETEKVIVRLLAFMRYVVLLEFGEGDLVIFVDVNRVKINTWNESSKKYIPCKKVNGNYKYDIV